MRLSSQLIRGFNGYEPLASSYELISNENQLVAGSLQLEARDIEQLYHISSSK